MDTDRHPPKGHDDHGAQRPRVLRGGSLVPAPLVLVGLVCVAVGLLNVGWSASASADGSAWVEAIAFSVVGVGFLVVAAGCRVVVRSGEVLDQVGFVTVRRLEQAGITTVRTRAGVWRTFEVETHDGRRSVLLGCGPLQFPANLMVDAAERDLSRVDTITGSVRS